jgi:hypothetical protein
VGTIAVTVTSVTAATRNLLMTIRAMQKAEPEPRGMFRLEIAPIGKMSRSACGSVLKQADDLGYLLVNVVEHARYLPGESGKSSEIDRLLDEVTDPAH